jgi:hypothetical protein
MKPLGLNVGGVNAVSSTSIVHLVKMVYLQDFQKTTPPPNKDTYPLVA